MEHAKEPGWGEIFLPLQTLQPLKIELQEPKKLYTPVHGFDRPLGILSYGTDTYKLPVLNILTPFVKVHSWDSSTGRLELECEPESLTYKHFHIIQDAIVHLLQAHPTWLKANGSSKEELKHTFQQMLKDTILTVYLHGQNQDTKPAGRVWIWKDGSWSKGVTPSSFKRGQQLRVALRLQGVCFLPHPGFQTRLRVQHQTVAVLHKTAAVP